MSNFPERLQPELHETLGYLFYKENIYDSAAFHLSKATDLDNNKPEKARREYLTAQLYMASGLNEDAAKYFNRSAEHTVDPVMAVNANLNAITASGDSVNTIDKKVAALLRLARKDRYVTYRDMIYYAVAEAEIERKNYPDAYAYLKKSIKYNADNQAQRSRSFMLLGDLDYLRPDYKTAANDYDSVDMSGLTSPADQQRLTERLTALQTITTNLAIVHIEDSLQTVAHLPEAERTALIKNGKAITQSPGIKR